MLTDLKTDISAMSREDLEAIAFNAVGVRYYSFTDLTGAAIGCVAANVDEKLLNKIWLNLRSVNLHATLDDLVAELIDRDIYARKVEFDNVQVMTLNI